MPATADPQSADSTPSSASEATGLVVTGTPHGRWQGLARALLASADAAAAFDHDDALSRMTGADRGRPALVFVDGPAHAVAQCLTANPDGDPAEALGAWCDAAQRLLRCAHAHPGTCLLVDTEEAAADPAALLDLMTQRFGNSVPAVSPFSGLPVADPVALALGAGLARDSRQAQSLFAHMRASCMPLSADEGHALARERIDFDAAVRGWRALLHEPDAREARLSAQAAQVQREVDAQLAEAGARQQALRAEADALLLNLHRTQEELEAMLLERAAPNPAEARAQGLSAEIDTLRASLESKARERAELKAELDGARQASASLQRDLHDTRTLAMRRDADLTALRLASDALANDLAERSSAHDQARRQIGNLVAQVDSLGAQVTALQAQAQRHEVELGAAHSLADERQCVVEQLSARLADGQRATELQLLQMQTLQEELAHHYLLLKALDSAPVSRGAGALRVDDAVITDASHRTPHHHLQLELQGVHAGERSLPRVTVRLAEHEGRPGIVLLVAGDGTPPLAAWQPTGEEGGRELMTLVPADDSTQRVLNHLATDDWLLVVGLVDLLHHRLSDTTTHPEAARWHVVAARLRRQLAQLAPRLRYADISLTAVEDPPTQQRLDVRFGRAVFGQESLDDLHLQWRPAGSLGSERTRVTLCLLRPGAGREPPLAGWPVTSEGHVEETLIVPVGPGMPAAEKRRRWAALSAADRDLLLALLDALPACAGKAQAAGLDPRAVESAARILHRDALAVRRQMRWRTLLRRMLRRAPRG